MSVIGAIMRVWKVTVRTHVLSYDRPSSLDVGAGRLLLETSGGVALARPARTRDSSTGRWSIRRSRAAGCDR